jgi:hypothetical protein
MLFPNLFYYGKPAVTITRIYNNFCSHLDFLSQRLVEGCKAAMTNCFSGGHPSLANANYNTYNTLSDNVAKRVYRIRMTVSNSYTANQFICQEL